MNREVISPRRSLRWFYALAFVTGCATATIRHAVENDRRGSDVSPLLPALVDFTLACQSTWTAPAVLCVPGFFPVHDGCHWRCAGELSQ